MKASTILTLCIALLFIRCKTGNNTKDLSGTYVRQTMGEYAIDYDTIVVSLDHSSSNTYSIQNNTGFEKVRNKAILPKEFKRTSWVAIWDGDKQILSEADLGRQIQFKDNGKSLILKNSTYSKLK